MNYAELQVQWKSEENAVFKGWDFSRLNDRWEHEPLSWDYDVFVRKYLKSNDVLLDMGVGGGEYLLSLNHPYNLTFATEGYVPNFELCQNTLAPLGITIKQVFDDNDLPFRGETFDIAINRHESFNISEVKRILKPNGIFITQQVGDKNSWNLSEKLSLSQCRTNTLNNLKSNVSELEKHGFDIIYRNEAFPITKFYDVGAIVYFAKIIEWEFPNFSVDSCISELYGLQQQIEQQGYVENEEHRFIIVAIKNL